MKGFCSVIEITVTKLSVGAILGATEAIATRSYARDVYMQTKHVPDWNNLADNVKEIDIRSG